MGKKREIEFLWLLENPLTPSQQKRLDWENFLRENSSNLPLRSCISNVLRTPIIENEKIRQAIIYEGKACNYTVSGTVFLFVNQPDFKKRMEEIREETVFLFLSRKSKRPCRELKNLGICDESCVEAKSKKKAKKPRKPIKGGEKQK